jgi:hypothetical protein
VLSSTVSVLSRVFIIVDALDECPEEHRHTLLRCLSELGPSVSLMLTSRPHINIGHIVSNFELLTIRAMEDDIRAYLDGQILKSSRLSNHIANSQDLREAIEAKIVQRSNGMLVDFDARLILPPLH